MQAALERQARGLDTPPPAPVVVATERPTTLYTQLSRQGKVNVTGYFAPAVKSSFRMIQSAYPDKTIQGLAYRSLE